MLKNIKTIITVLNDFALAHEVLEKSFDLAKRFNAPVEVLYVHESPLFKVPDYFSSKHDKGIDKEKIKEAIKDKIAEFTDENIAIFTYIDDTVSRVKELARDTKELLIVTSFHKDITQKLINKISQPILTIKTKEINYKNIGLILNNQTESICVKNAKEFFKNSSIHLLYDYRYIVDPSMEIDLQNVQIIENAQREAFENIKKDNNLDGEFFVDGSFFGGDLIDYIKTQDYDLIYLCSQEDDFFVLDNISVELLEKVDIDILVANNN